MADIGLSAFSVFFMGSPWRVAPRICCPSARARFNTTAKYLRLAVNKVCATASPLDVLQARACSATINSSRFCLSRYNGDRFRDCFDGVRSVAARSCYLAPDSIGVARAGQSGAGALRIRRGHATCAPAEHRPWPIAGRCDHYLGSRGRFRHCAVSRSQVAPSNGSKPDVASLAVLAAGLSLAGTASVFAQTAPTQLDCVSRTPGSLVRSRNPGGWRARHSRRTRYASRRSGNPTRQRRWLHLRRWLAARQGSRALPTGR